MEPLLAIAPILLIIVLMIGPGWSAARAGLAGLAATLLIAILAFGYGVETLPMVGPARATAGALAEAVFTAATILWIIFPALCIYELQVRGGAFDVLKAGLGQLSDDPRILAILVAWFFALFVEGAAGFGTPIALAAPMLVGLGFPPLRALVLALIGHSVGVSFGAVGTPVLPQIAATGLAETKIAGAIGSLHALLGWLMLIFVVRLAGDGRGGARSWTWTAVAALLFLLPLLLISRFIGPELPTLGGALLGAMVFVALFRRFDRSAGGARASGEVRPAAILHAALPYLVLLVVILVTRLIPPVREAFRAIEWSWLLEGGFAGGVQPLYHPGTALLFGFLGGAALQGRRRADLREAALRASQRLPSVVIALCAMLGLARLMVHAGMIDVLAEAAAASLGPIWPGVAPFVGVLGTFVTGSATASNILLTDFQAATAERLGLPVLWLTAAQGFGAAVGNIVCPHNIVAGAATVGLAGREGPVLRQTILPCIAYGVAGGLLLFVIVG